jgi:gamma-glutamylcyclotransferase
MKQAELPVALVFQYGSNCLDSQINSQDRLGGDAVFIGIAETVEPFQLSFDVWSSGRACAAANIVPSPGNTVWGALYEIPEFLIGRDTAKARNRRSLDGIEGKHYQRKLIALRFVQGNRLEALTYVVATPQPLLKTNAEYVGFIIRGLRERGVHSGYIDEVKAIASTNNPDISTEIEDL